MDFSDAQIMALKPGQDPARYPTGYEGLYLHLGKTGIRSWRLETSQRGIRHTITMARWPECKLDEAKLLVVFYKKQMAQGYTPREIKTALANMPANPIVKIVKLQDGRTIVACTDQTNQQEFEDPAVAQSVDVSEMSIDGARLMGKSLNFIAQAKKLKRQINELQDDNL